MEESKEGGMQLFQLHGIFCEGMYYLKSAKSAVLFLLSIQPLTISTSLVNVIVIFVTFNPRDCLMSRE